MCSFGHATITENTGIGHPLLIVVFEFVLELELVHVFAVTSSSHVRIWSALPANSWLALAAFQNPRAISLSKNSPTTE